MELGLDSASLPFGKNQNLLSSTDNLQLMEQDAMSAESPASKRYSLSQDIRDSFYAIHHIKEPEEDNNNNNSENITPPSVAAKKPASGQRGRKRLQDKPSQTNTAAYRKKQRHSKSKAVLYQTCSSIWPEQHTTLNDSHDYIKSLSELVKIRLSQAKFKLLAQLDKDHALYPCLAETLTAPAPPIHRNDRNYMHLINKHNKSTMSVVGNNKNLFARNKASKRRLSTTYTEAIFDLSPSSTPIDEYGIIASPSRQTDTPNKSTKDRKKRTPKAPSAKPRRITTPKRKSAAADVVPVTLSDGSSVYVCEPCNKRYKNRNGLAYHLERCKNKIDKENEQPNKDKSLDPATTTNKKEDDGDGDDEHDDEDDDHDDDEVSSSPEEHQMGKDLLQSLLEAQANDLLLAKQNPIVNASSSFSQFNDELFRNQTQDSQQKDEEEEEEDELFSVHTAEEATANSSQLHIWDDFNVNSAFENTTHEQWKLPDDEDPFSTNYDTDLPSSSWQMNDINLFSQPPSLLFSDTTMNSALDDPKPLLEELTPISTSDIMVNSTTPLATAETPNHTPLSQSTPDGGLWFQFANFDDDYQQKQQQQQQQA